MRSFSIKNILPCLMAIVVDSLGFGLVYPIFTAIFLDTKSPLFTAHITLQMRDFYLGLGFLLYPLFMFFGASFMGDLSDMMGRKRVLLICMGGMMFSFLLMGIGANLGSIGLIMVGRSFSGLMSGAQPIAQAAISDQSEPHTKARNMSLLTFVFSLGIALGPVIGGVLCDASLYRGFNYSTPFYFSSLLACLAFFWLLLGFSETFTPKEGRRFHWLRPVQIFIEAFRHRSVRLLSIIFLFMQVGFSLFFQLILVFLQNHFGYSSAQLGLFNGFVGFSFAVGLLFAIRFITRLMRIEYVAVCFLLITGICQLFVASEMQWVIWCLAFPLSVADMVAYTGMLTSFSNAASAENQGWVMGIAGSVAAVSWALTGLSTNLLGRFSPSFLIVAGGGLLILSGAVMLYYCRAHRLAVRDDTCR